MLKEAAGHPEEGLPAVAAGGIVIDRASVVLLMLQRGSQVSRIAPRDRAFVTMGWMWLGVRRKALNSNRIASILYLLGVMIKYTVKNRTDFGLAVMRESIHRFVGYKLGL